MKSSLIQPQGSTLVNSILASIARIFNVKQDSVCLLDNINSIDSFSLIYENESQLVFDGTSATGIPTTWEITNDILVLVTSTGTFNLNQVSIPTMLEPEFTSKVSKSDLINSTDPTLGDAMVAVKQLFTGAVGRTQDDKNRDIVSVKDFGAVGDGVTDDSISIGKAFDTGCFFLPKGDFLINDKNLILKLQYSYGEGNLIFNSISYPAGNINGVEISLNVPSIFPEIQTALDWLQGKRINKTIVYIRVADGNYDCNQITHQHPDGNLIQIIGNTIDPTKVILTFDSSNFNSGIHISNSASLSLIDGFTITTKNGKSSHGVWDSSIKPYGAGIMASYGGSISVGSSIIVSNFYYGIKAEYSGSINCSKGVTVSEAGDVGFHAIHSGSIFCLGCTVYGVWDTAFNIGSGFMAEQSGTIHAENSISHDNYYSGFFAVGGSIWAQNSSSYNNNIGYLSELNGYINASSPTWVTGDITTASVNNTNVIAARGGAIEFYNAISKNSKGDGIVSNGGSINANGATSENNTQCGFVSRNNGVIFGTYTSSSNGNNDLSENGGILAASMS